MVIYPIQPILDGLEIQSVQNRYKMGQPILSTQNVGNVLDKIGK